MDDEGERAFHRPSFCVRPTPSLTVGLPPDSLDQRVQLLGHARVDSLQLLVSLKRHLLVAALPVGESEVEERAGVVWLEADGLGVRGDGLLVAAEAAQRDAEVVL